jgi:hypothetical protein
MGWDGDKNQEIEVKEKENWEKDFRTEVWRAWKLTESNCGKCITSVWSK